MTNPTFGYAKMDQPEVLGYLFHPRRDVDGSPPAGAVDHDFTVEEGVSLGARFFLGREEDPNILFFHGNGEIVSDYDAIGPQYVKHGLSLFAVDYRGYGRSGGSPSVTSMMHDAHAVFKQVKDWLAKTNRTGPLVVMGRSLGSASAVELAASYQEEVAGLIIESGFARTIPLLCCLGVDTAALGLTEADGFKNVEKMKQITKPTLIVHARHDQIIPVMEAETLQVHCAARSKEFSMIPGADHNTIMVRTGDTYFEMIKCFTNKIEGKRVKCSFREKRERRQGKP